MFGWLAGAESDQDTQEPRKVTRSGKLTEKTREEAIKKAETEKLATESHKRYRKYVRSLETDPEQNPAHIPPGGDTPPTDEEVGDQQDQNNPQNDNNQQAGVGAGGDGTGDNNEGNSPNVNNTQENMVTFEDENGTDDDEWYKKPVKVCLTMHRTLNSGFAN